MTRPAASPKRRTGPAKRTPGSFPKPLEPLEVREAILKNLESGMGIRDSGQRAGVDGGSLFNWRAEGTKHGGELGAFVDEMNRARLGCKLTNLRRIAAAAEGGEETTRTTVTEKLNTEGVVVERSSQTVVVEHPRSWQAAAWLLERLFPAEFARVTRLEAFEEAGEDGDRGEAHAPNPENVRSIIDRIAAREAAGPGAG